MCGRAFLREGVMAWQNLDLTLTQEELLLLRVIRWSTSK